VNGINRTFVAAASTWLLTRATRTLRMRIVAGTLPFSTIEERRGRER